MRPAPGLGALPPRPGGAVARLRIPRRAPERHAAARRACCSRPGSRRRSSRPTSSRASRPPRRFAVGVVVAPGARGVRARPARRAPARPLGRRSRAPRLRRLRRPDRPLGSRDLRRLHQAGRHVDLARVHRPRCSSTDGRSASLLPPTSGRSTSTWARPDTPSASVLPLGVAARLSGIDAIWALPALPGLPGARCSRSGSTACWPGW